MIRINMPTMLPCVLKEAEAVKLVRSLSAYSFSFSLTADKLHSTFKRSNICLFKPKINKNNNK